MSLIPRSLIWLQFFFFFVQPAREGPRFSVLHMDIQLFHQCFPDIFFGFFVQNQIAVVEWVRFCVLCPGQCVYFYSISTIFVIMAL